MAGKEIPLDNQQIDYYYNYRDCTKEQTATHMKINKRKLERWMKKYWVTPAILKEDWERIQKLLRWKFENNKNNSEK